MFLNPEHSLMEEVNKPVADHWSTKAQIADTIGIPIAAGNPKIRLLKIVVNNDNAMTTTTTCRKK